MQSPNHTEENWTGDPVGRAPESGQGGALEDRDPRVREEAARALVKMGPQARSAAGSLTALLRDRHRKVRDAARAALKAIGTGEGS